MKPQSKNHPSFIQKRKRKKGLHCLYREFTSSARFLGPQKWLKKPTFNLYRHRKNVPLEYCVWVLWGPSTRRNKEESGKWWHWGGESVSVIMCSGNYQSYSLRAPSRGAAVFTSSAPGFCRSLARGWNWVYLRHPLLVSHNITHHESPQENHTRGGPMSVQQSDVLYVFWLDCDVNEGRLMSFNQLLLLTCSCLSTQEWKCCSAWTL